MQIHHLGDLAFAEFKEKLHKQELSWEQLSAPFKQRVKLIDKKEPHNLFPVDKLPFTITTTVHSVGKKNDKGEEWRLVTFRVRFDSKAKGKKSLFKNKGRKHPHILDYQCVVKKESSSAAPIGHS